MSMSRPVRDLLLSLGSSPYGWIQRTNKLMGLTSSDRGYFYSRGGGW